MLPILSLVFAAAAAPQGAPSSAITIYSSAQPGAVPPEAYRPVQGALAPWSPAQVPGYALVRVEREFEVPQARATVRFTDVAALIDPTTVAFASLTDPEGTRVLDQSFQFDLVSTAKLLERYLDREVTLERRAGGSTAFERGTLLSTAGGIVLRREDGAVSVVTSYDKLQLPELPGGLTTRPTLVWDLATAKPGAHRARVSYQTGGITWWADYNVVFAEGADANQGTLDVAAWVSILNQSGGSYENARLKLVAGDVHRAEAPMSGRRGGRAGALAAKSYEAEGFAEKSFFEYHLYTLGRPATIPDRSTRQLELFPAAKGVPCEKVLVYYGLEPGYRGFSGDPAMDRDFGTQSNKKVDVYLRFKNAKDGGLGMPLPAGRIRVSKLDAADGSLEFVGEDVVDHTPKDEPVLVKMGSAFDVVGERRQVEFRVDTARKWMEEEIEIKVRNHKAEPVTVLAKENLYRWVNWEITKKTKDFEKVDARTIHFPLTIAKDGEGVVRYTVRYSW